MIDGIATTINHVHGSIAKGFILRGDLTEEPCFVVKGNGFFAHGKTLREAMAALTDKRFEDMPENQRIEQFVKEHPDKDKPYPNRDLFDWHHRLTGSCKQGRLAFIRDHNLDLGGETTVPDFIALTKNAYNGGVIRKLKEYYQ